MTTTATSITYGEGGFDPAKPNGNMAQVVEQDYDDDGSPVGEPRVTVYEDAT